jgi:hypothetical protein
MARPRTATRRRCWPSDAAPAAELPRTKRHAMLDPAMNPNSARPESCSAATRAQSARWGFRDAHARRTRARPAVLSAKQSSARLRSTACSNEQREATDRNGPQSGTSYGTPHSVDPFRTSWSSLASDLSTTSRCRNPETLPGPADVKCGVGHATCAVHTL